MQCVPLCSSVALSGHSSNLITTRIDAFYLIVVKIFPIAFAHSRTDKPTLLCALYIHVVYGLAVNYTLSIIKEDRTQ